MEDSPNFDPNELDKLKPLRRLKKSVGIRNLWLWILKLLREDKKYGYELREELKKRFGIKPATVTSYSVIYKLQKDGLITKAEVTATDSGRIDRKYYKITPKGIALLERAELLLKNILDLLASNPDDPVSENHFVTISDNLDD